MASPLRNPTYRRLFIAHVIAVAGSGLATVALALLAYDLAGGSAGAVLGTALAIKMIAYVSLAPVFGAFARRLPRRALLVTLDLARAACVVGLLFVTEIWHIYLIIFLLNACSAGFTPAFQATIPDVLPDEADYTRALSLSRLAYDMENLLSPTVAAIALLVFSYDALFAANMMSFVVSALLVMSVRLPTPSPPTTAGGIWYNTTFGIRAYLKTPRLRGLLALSLAASAAGSMIIVNTVVLVRASLGGTQSDTAIALAGAGAGSMLVALALPRLLRKRPDRTLMLAGGCLLITGLLFGLRIDSLLVLLLIWFVLGAGLSFIQTPAGRLLVRSSSEGDRPAMYAAQFALSHACWLITYPLAGWIGVVYGIPSAFIVLASIAALSTCMAWRAWPMHDPSEVEHAHHPVEHEHLHVHDEHHQHAHDGWEGQEPHSHPHSHGALRHAHPFVIDLHHSQWPR